MTMLQWGEPRTSLTVVVAANVRAETARRGMTATELALAIGMNRSALYSRWHGERQWQLEDLERVSDVLRVPVEQLVRREGIEPPTRWYGASPSRAATVTDLAAHRARQDPTAAAS